MDDNQLPEDSPERCVQGRLRQREAQLSFVRDGFGDWGYGFQSMSVTIKTHNESVMFCIGGVDYMLLTYEECAMLRGFLEAAGGYRGRDPNVEKR